MAANKAAKRARAVVCVGGVVCVRGCAMLAMLRVECWLCVDSELIIFDYIVVSAAGGGCSRYVGSKGGSSFFAGKCEEPQKKKNNSRIHEDEVGIR